MLTPQANISLFNGDTDSTLGVWALEESSTLAKKQRVRIKPLKSHRTYDRWNRNHGALGPWVKPDEHSTEKRNLAKPASNEMFSSWINQSKLVVAMERKGYKHVCQKQHRTVTIIALSSCFVNRETRGKVFAETWRECQILVSETTHYPGKDRRTSSLMSKGAWMKSFRILEGTVPFLLVINQSVQENTPANISVIT